MAKQNLEFRIFKPPYIGYSSLNIENLNTLTGKKWQYASSGKACLFHILKALHVKGKILLPAYACDSILVPVRILNLEPVFYDVDICDLNPDIHSISKLALEFDIKTLLVVSLYGNPANLEEIETFCHKYDIKLIDDAAQSFGASLNGKLVGTFGHAGFFSFSPGKATAGHMGGFFWTNESYKYISRKHSIVHYIRWLDFYFNRYRIYEYQYLGFWKKILSLFSAFCLNHIDLYYDSISPFEKKILGGILSGNLNGKYKYRNIYIQEFIKRITSNLFDVIISVRGVANTHKLVLLFVEKEDQKIWKIFFDENQIYCSEGYVPLKADLDDLPNLQNIKGKIIELPIEDDLEKMEYLLEKIERFLNRWK